MVPQVLSTYGEYAFHVEGENAHDWRSTPTEHLLDKEEENIKQMFEVGTGELTEKRHVLLHILRQTAMERVKSTLLMKSEGKNAYYDNALIRYGEHVLLLMQVLFFSSSSLCFLQ